MMMSLHGTLWCEKCQRFTLWLITADEPVYCADCYWPEGGGEESQSAADGDGSK